MREKQDKKRTVNNHYDGHAPPQVMSKDVQKYAEAEDVLRESDAGTNSAKAVSVTKTVTTVLSNKIGELYVDKAIGMIISVVIGSPLLSGLYYMFNSVILPGMADRIQDMFGSQAVSVIPENAVSPKFL